jgi:hypothetical protein
VWHITYESVPCLSNWSGAKNAAALGSVKELGTSACCPAEPQPGNASNSCPSYSDKNGIPYVPQHSPIQSTNFNRACYRPDTKTSVGVTNFSKLISLRRFAVLVILLSLC